MVHVALEEGSLALLVRAVKSLDVV